jgi:hypothetical protein
LMNEVPSVPETQKDYRHHGFGDGYSHRGKVKLNRRKFVYISDGMEI